MNVLPILAMTMLMNTPRVDVYVSDSGGWAQSKLHHEPGTEQLMLGLDIKRGYGLAIDGRGAVMVRVRNKRTGDLKWVKDVGVKVREGLTNNGWKDTLIENGSIVVCWSDDGQMRIRYRRTRPGQRVVPTRLLVYLPAGEVLGQRHHWEIVGVEFVPGMTEVVRCD